METDRPEWMQDPSLQSIDPKKLEFLSKLFAQGVSRKKTTGQKELMAALLPAIAQARKENLMLTPAEVGLAIQAIKRHSTKEELEKMERIMHQTGAASNERKSW